MLYEVITPYDYPMHHIYNKQLIFTTTNGTRAMQKCSEAAECTIAAMLNAGAVVKYCQSSPLPISIVMAGTKGMFAIEDALCAGAIVYGLNRSHKADDLGNVCADLFFEHLETKNFYSAIMEGNHAKHLAENGFIQDIKFCSQFDIYDIIPTYKEGRITSYNVCYTKLLRI